jgi:hypothetical protein
MAALIDRLFRLGMRRGLMGGSRPWLYVGLTAGAVRVLRRIVTEPVTVYRTELKPGEHVEITVSKPSGG